jgi:dTDP-4-amino-4,6-dideoxygalactose transaminase
MKMQVPFIDLKPQYMHLRAEIHSAIERVMASQAYILGEDEQTLSKEVAEYTQTKYGIACASGSDALLLALMALEIGAGDEVITTSYSFFATAGAIARVGARPRFVDIELKTYNIDVSKIEESINEHTRAIMPVHLFGQCADMDAILEVSERYEIPVVEDAAQAIGASDKGRRAGSLGDIGCFSFYPTKNLGGAGDGGMLTTTSESLAERLRILRVHGAVSKYNHQLVGINSRLDTLQAAILRVKLPYLEDWSRARENNANRYRRLFAEASLLEQIALPTTRDGTRHIYNQFVIRVPGGVRDSLREHLRREQIGTEVYYPIPLHMQKCFSYLGYSGGALPVSEAAANETLALPIYPELTEEQQVYVVNSIRHFFFKSILR